MFTAFKQAVQRQFNEMKKQPVYRSAVDPDNLWRHYLSSFPEGTNPIFRERIMGLIDAQTFLDTVEKMAQQEW